MSRECIKLHELVKNKRVHNFPYNEKEIPTNGIYILFERGEASHGGDRIVRIGTHTGKDQLRSRLRQHFLIEKKDRSIFRKNIGRAILNRDNDPYLEKWELDITSSQAKAKFGRIIDKAYQQFIESKVTKYIQENFFFCVLELGDKEERMMMESRLISTVSGCKICGSSPKWLGNFSPVDKIRQSGMWQVQELYKQPLTESELARLEELLV